MLHDTELGHVEQLCVENAAEHQVVGPLLVMIAEAEEAAVAALAEELQRRVVPRLKRPDLVLARHLDNLASLELDNIGEDVFHALTHLVAVQHENLLGVLHLHAPAAASLVMHGVAQQLTRLLGPARGEAHAPHRNHAAGSASASSASATACAALLHCTL